MSLTRLSTAGDSLSRRFLNLTSPPQIPLLDGQRAQALAIFNGVLAGYRSALPYTPADKYDVAGLVELMHEHAVSALGKDNILRNFLNHLAKDPSIKPEEFDRVLAKLTNYPEDQRERLNTLVQEFSRHLVTYFLGPMRALGGKTPDPSAALSPDASVSRVGIKDRLASLKTKVAVRDRNRCVITGAFSTDEYDARIKAEGNDAKDNDGLLFTELDYNTPLLFSCLDTAHIIPRCIGSRASSSDGLSKSQITTQHILNMFDPGVADVIAAENIDSPRNAILLTKDLHDRFGKFRIYFDKADDRPDTYFIRATDHANLSLRSYNFPRTHTFESETIELPSPRLFAIHKSCAIILHLTGAAGYIEDLYKDDEVGNVAADGSTELGSLLVLGLLRNPIRSY